MKIKLLCVGFLLIFISGCGTRNLNINYLPESFRSNPLSTLSPKSFYIRIEDNRPDNEVEFVGYYYKFTGKAPYTSSLLPTEILSTALIKILKDNGHEAITDGESNSTDLMISVQLKKFLQDYRMRDMKGNATSILLGHINADIAIINRTNNQEIFKKTVNTINSQPFLWNLEKSYEAAYSKHIEQFLDDIFLDFELIGSLKKI